MRIVVVSLNIPFVKTDEWDDISIYQKLNRIESRIQNLCAKLFIEEPDAMWLFSWREKTISDYQTNFASKKVEDYFIKTMQGLTLTYPNLVIAGNIQSVEYFSAEAAKSHLDKIIKSYESYRWIYSIEHRKNGTYEFASHQAKALQLKNDLLPSYGAIKNRVYVFQGNQIFCHDKSSPFQETNDRVTSSCYYLYQPPLDEGTASIFKLIHPVTYKTITLGIEICREHWIGTLRRTAKKMPMIHLVVSSSISTIDENIFGNYFIHLDSRNYYSEKAMLTSPSISDKLQLRLIANDLFKDNHPEFNIARVNHSYFFYHQTRTAKRQSESGCNNTLGFESNKRIKLTPK